MAQKKAKPSIAAAHRGYRAMTRYTPARADEIAVALFDELTSAFREHPIILGRISGIGEVTLWKWRTGRVAVNVDTIAAHCDDLVSGLGLPPELAEQAANLMAGIPWRGKRTGSQILRYVVAYGLDAATLFHLARRQARMGVTRFAALLGVTQALFSRISAPADCHKEYASHRGSLKLTSIARRIGLAAQDEIAEFRLLIISDTVTPRVSQRELAAAFLDGATSQPRSAFVRQFLKLLKERHGLPRRASVADAIWEQAAQTSPVLYAEANVKALKRRLSKIIKIKHGRLPDIWAEAMARFAFPGEREVRLRLALARYLKT
jgi:hypothetical protein